MNTAASTPPFEKGGMIRGRLIYPVEIMSPLPGSYSKPSPKRMAVLYYRSEPPTQIITRLKLSMKGTPN